MDSKNIGVIVARFQVPELHDGHRYLIDHVRERHARVLIVLGYSEAHLTTRNPLDVATRLMMVQAAYPDVRVASLPDMRCDQLWSKTLDHVINQEFPGCSAVLYGSRSSFLSQYHGRHQCQEIPPLPCPAATEVRETITAPLDSMEFRQGVIYAARQKYPTSYQTVDVAVLNGDRTKVLMAMKVDDNNRWRFIGGFVDPADASLEAAAKREVTEETSMIETDDYIYLGSSRVFDYRYPRGDVDAIMTALFAATYIFGAPTPKDDIVRLEWRPIDELENTLVPEHQALGAQLRAYLATVNHGRSDHHATKSF